MVASFPVMAASCLGDAAKAALTAPDGGSARCPQPDTKASGSGHHCLKALIFRRLFK